MSAPHTAQVRVFMVAAPVALNRFCICFVSSMNQCIIGHGQCQVLHYKSHNLVDEKCEVVYTQVKGGYGQCPMTASDRRLKSGGERIGGRKQNWLRRWASPTGPSVIGRRASSRRACVICAGWRKRSAFHLHRLNSLTDAYAQPHGNRTGVV